MAWFLRFLVLAGCLVLASGAPALARANAAAGSLLLARTSGAEPEVPAWPMAESRTGPRPVALALADLDGDGRPELLVVEAAEPSLTVRRNDGAGGFGSPVAYPLDRAPTYPGPSCLAIGDLDGDGDPDVVVAAPGNSGLAVFRAEDGVLRLASTFAAPAGPGATALADLDGRPGAELARVDLKQRRVSLLRFRPDGSPEPWQQVDLGAGEIGWGEAWAGDLDGDGDGDLVLVHPQPGSMPPSGYELITALGADGGATWTVARVPVAGENRYRLVVVDVNGDRLLDVVAAGSPAENAAMGQGSPNLSTWLAIAPGILTAPQHHRAGQTTGDLCAADFDGDGRADVSLVDRDGRVRVWSSSGGGGFTALADLPFGDRLTEPSLACGDLDRDGDADLVAADARTGRLAVFHNPRVFAADTAPWAEAGEGGWVLGGAEVRLDGRRSGDADGDLLEFAWRQVSGPPVALSDAGASVALFTAQQTLDVLVFALQVTDDRHTSAPDSVSLRVRPMEYPVHLQHAPQAVWEAVLQANAPFSAIAVSPVNPDRIYAGTYRDGVYCSRDGGATWQRSVAGIDTLEDYGRHFPVRLCVLALAAHPENELVAFMGTEGGGYRTLDGGESWQLAAFGARDIVLAHQSMWVGMGEGGGIWVGDDMGESFVQINGNLPSNDYGGTAAVPWVAVDPFDPRVVYAVAAPWGHSLYRTLDGSLWQPVRAPAWYWLPIATSPHTGWLYLGLHLSEGGTFPVLRSRDLAASWDESGRGLEGVVEASDFAFDPTEPLVVWVTTELGVHWSGDGGATWQRLEGQPPASAGLWYGNGPVCKRPLAVSAGPPQRLFTGADSTLYRATLVMGSTAVMELRGNNAARSLRLLAPYPNPSNSAVVLAYETDRAAPAVLSVHDLLGQVVWRHRAAAGESGPRRVVWPGTTADGRPVATGIYLVRLESGGRSDCVRLALIR